MAAFFENKIGREVSKQFIDVIKVVYMKNILEVKQKKMFLFLKNIENL